MAEARAPRSVQRSRRRFARRQWRRRARAWRWLVPLVLVLALVAAGVWAVKFSSLLAVEDVDVTGVRTLSAADVRGISGITTGTPLVDVDTTTVAHRVESLMQVRSVDVTRKWPHTIVVAVRERTPIAVVEIAGKLRALDETGAVFGGYKVAPPGLPKVEPQAGTTTRALREAAAVVAALPAALSAKVDHVSVEGVDDIQLVLRDGRTAQWGSAADSATKAQVLLKLLDGVQAKSFDVSVPSRPTVR